MTQDPSMTGRGGGAYAGVEGDGTRIDAGAGELDQLLKFDGQLRHDARVADNQSDRINCRQPDAPSDERERSRRQIIYADRVQAGQRRVS